MELAVGTIEVVVRVIEAVVGITGVVGRVVDLVVGILNDLRDRESSISIRDVFPI